MTRDEIMALGEGRPADGLVAAALGWRWLAERHQMDSGGGWHQSEWRRFLAPPGWQPPEAFGMEFRDADGTETPSAVWYCRFGDLMVPRYTGDDGEALRLLVRGGMATGRAVLALDEDGPAAIREGKAGGVVTVTVGREEVTDAPRLAIAKAFLLAHHNQPSQ